jgi:hypothetical protein
MGIVKGKNWMECSVADLPHVVNDIPEQQVYLHHWLCCFFEYVEQAIKAKEVKNLDLDRINSRIVTRFLLMPDTCPSCNAFPYKVQICTDDFLEVEGSKGELLPLIIFEGREIQETDQMAPYYDKPLFESGFEKSLRVFQEINQSCIADFTIASLGNRTKAYYELMVLMHRFIGKQTHLLFKIEDGFFLTKFVDEAFEIKVKLQQFNLLQNSRLLNKLAIQADELGIPFK